jgi:hypothetical protein
MLVMTTSIRNSRSYCNDACVLSCFLYTLNVRVGRLTAFVSGFTSSKVLIGIWGPCMSASATFGSGGGSANGGTGPMYSW